jgi:histidinol-phosphatase (PHP family)
VIVDYHTHLRSPKEGGSEPLSHSLETLERFVERAAQRGVDEIGFTEHVYYFRQTRELWSLPYQIDRCRHDLDAYCNVIEEGRRRGFPVKLGLEVDYVGSDQERLAELLAPYPWDYLLGSVHWIEGQPVDQEPGMWSLFPIEEVWRRYMRCLVELARSGAVDVLAHPDLAKIFSRRPAPPVLAELHREAAEAIARADVAIEISTAGLRKPVGEIYPDEEFLRALRECGVPITTAADAHEAHLVGEDFERSLELARRAGYETVSVFERRSRRQELLG